MTTRILGIDPGSRLMGYGILAVEKSQQTWLASGTLRMQQPTLAERLRHIHQQLTAIITEWQPDEFAIEQVFSHRNADSALKLGQARGVALCVAALHDLPVHEYSARSIKQSVVGTGAADKQQIQHMVKALLKRPENPQADEADALAIALCHAHMRSGLAQLANAESGKRTRRRWRATDVGISS